MSSQTAMSLLDLMEFALWAVVGFLFWKKKQQRRFPAMGRYLALHLASTPPLLLFFFGDTRHWFNDYSFVCYFSIFWAVYIVSAVLLYFVCIEVFRSAMMFFPGLQLLGTVAFRWTTLVSVILSLSTLHFEQHRALIVTGIAYKLMHSVSILELCLLGFLCVSMNALRLSVRDMAFGIALGFGLMSSNDFVVGSLLSRNHSLIEPLQFVYESLILVSLGIWVVYCALPERARVPVLLPAGSVLFRWNEIALALGHGETQVALRPAGSFPRTEVERAAESVLIGNLKRRESET